MRFSLLHLAGYFARFKINLHALQTRFARRFFSMHVLNFFAGGVHLAPQCEQAGMATENRQGKRYIHHFPSFPSFSTLEAWH